MNAPRSYESLHSPRGAVAMNARARLMALTLLGLSACAGAQKPCAELDRIQGLCESSDRTDASSVSAPSPAPQPNRLPRVVPPSTGRQLAEGARNTASQVTAGARNTANQLAEGAQNTANQVLEGAVKLGDTARESRQIAERNAAMAAGPEVITQEARDVVQNIPDAVHGTAPNIPNPALLRTTATNRAINEVKKAVVRAVCGAVPTDSLENLSLSGLVVTSFAPTANGMKATIALNDAMKASLAQQAINQRVKEWACKQ